MKQFILFLVMILQAGSLVAQSADTSSYVLNPVVVSAKLSSDSLDNLDRQLHIVQRIELGRLNAATLENMLEHRPALDLRQRGAWDIQSDLHLRGATFNQNSIMVDGIPMNDPQTGHHNLNVPLENSDLERVEILYGGGSRISGAGSFSGAVNFITRLPQESEFRIRLKGGAYGLLGGDIDLGGKGAKLGIHHLQSDGFTQNTDFRNTRLFAGKEWNLASGDLRLTAGYQDKAFGAQNYYTARFPYQFEATRSWFTNAGWKDNKRSIELRLSWRRHWDRFELFREGEGYWTYSDGYFVDEQGDTASYAPGVTGWEYPGHNFHRNDAIYGYASKGFESKAGRTKLALSYRYEGIVSNVLGSELLDEPIAVGGREGLSPGYYTLKDGRTNYALFAEHNVQLGPIHTSIGLVYNMNSDFAPGFYPGIDLGYQLDANWRAYASYNRSFRLPTYTELYYTIGGAQGSQDLEQEISDNFELGARYSSDRFRLGFSAFRRLGREMIDWVFENDTAWARNITEVNMSGMEIYGDYSLQENSLGLDLIRMGYSGVFSDQDDLPIQSLYVLDYLRHKVYLFMDQSLFTDFHVHYQLSYQHRAGSFVDGNGITQIYDPFMLMDLECNYTLSTFQFQLGARNLFNAEYVDRPFVQQPGIWVYGGIEWRM
jgi:iron complex outermembrane receptor protein